jgi:hypothetical protein
MEGCLGPDLPNGAAQVLDVLDRKVVFSVEQVDREEIGAPGHAIAPVVGHRSIMPRLPPSARAVAAKKT